MSVTEAESPTALEPLTSGDDTHSIVKDHAHNASISSKDTLVVSFNDTLTDGLIAKHVESLSEVCLLEISIGMLLIFTGPPNTRGSYARFEFKNRITCRFHC